MTPEPKGCSCGECVKACHGQPGWFKPGEAERAAEFLGIPFEEFSRKFLIKDHCEPMFKNAPYVWSPRKLNVDHPDDDIRSYLRQRLQGTCVFLKDERCSIHPVKPFECQAVYACTSTANFRNKIEESWIEAGAPLGMRDEVDEGRRAPRPASPFEIIILGQYE